MAKSVALIGGDIVAARTALTLAELGVQVAMFTPAAALGLGNATNGSASSYEGLLRIWPLLLQVASHPRIKLYTNSRVETIERKQGEFTIKAHRFPRYVHEELCTGCGRCEETCSVKIPFILDGRRRSHTAIHAPIIGAKAVPSAYLIDKNGTAPCRAACPLGINVPGFVSLLSRGKIDKALTLINEAAPLAGVLGRVCTHPCESKCKRGDIDSPVFIQALHRYAADNAASGINYRRKAGARSKKDKIAIVGSGPAGLTAAWELARRGYSPTIFESHAVVGGMLATGIPRFRLPREVREREVEAIKALGVDIKTGITIGRDLTFSDLKEQEYRAFFLAIGAHLNNKLNIPGEDLDGVADSISLLFSLNLKVGTPVGSNVVIIGGGNSAVDSARTAKRRSKGTVQIIYRRTAEDMPAIKEDIEEAIKEGILIQYLTAPVEILGDGTKVTGLRCQRMRLGEMEADGRCRVEPIPGSEFVIDADHVVLAIGQRPNTSSLNLRGLNSSSDDSTIKVDELTLETNVPGVFAGGDCVTGPNNIVEAVAAGLRAARSIDRFLRGQDLRAGRSQERLQPAEVNVKERQALPYKRARMPLIHLSRRMGSFEETRIGLPMGTAEREAQRCINCALCCECLECEQACELGAVFHGDTAEQIETDASIIVNFTSGSSGSDDALTHCSPGLSSAPEFADSGIYTVPVGGDGGLWDDLTRASAIAMEVSLNPRLKEEETQEATPKSDVHLEQRHMEGPATRKEARIGVVLCRCGGSIGSVIDLQHVANELLRLGSVFCVEEVSQACSEEGARQIWHQAAKKELSSVVLAACRCCNLEQICFSCSDRRVLCQRYLSQDSALAHSTAVEFVNIREQCAWVHADDPVGATRKAMEIILSGVARAKWPLPVPIYQDEERPVEGSVFVVGAGLCGLAAAKNLAAQGHSVAIVSGPKLEKTERQLCSEYTDRRDSLLKQLKEQRIHVRPWPQVLELDGSPGNYKAVLRYQPRVSRIGAGAVILDLSEIHGGIPAIVNAIPTGSLIGRILPRISSSSPAGADTAALRELTIKETAGIFVISSDGGEPSDKQMIKGVAAAARASVYLGRGTLHPRATTVTINSRLCRSCGDCADICPYIEMRDCGGGGGITSAYVDQALCLGCGACVTCCPTGAITQGLQSDGQIISTMEALLQRANGAREVR